MASKKEGDAGAQYDGDLQMFRVKAHEPSKEALKFLRWMAEQGRLEHEISGPSSGEYAEVMVASFRSRAVNLGGIGLDGQSADPMVNAQAAYMPRAPRVIRRQPVLR